MAISIVNGGPAAIPAMPYYSPIDDGAITLRQPVGDRLKNNCGRFSASVLLCKAILLDNDGVLVDSAHSIMAAFTRWGASYGLDGQAIYDELHGHRAVEVARKVLPPHEADEGAARLDQYEFEQAADVRPLPGAKQLLDSLDGNWTLVSSGPRRLIERRLQAAGLPRPNIMVSADSVKSGKPDPESYILAAELNGVPPEECLAFEDSTTGLRSAIAAGCLTVQVGGDHPPRAIQSVADLSTVSVCNLGRGFKVILGVAG